MAAYTQCLRCAGAPRRPAGGSGLSLSIPSWHAALSDPGEFGHRMSRTSMPTSPSPRSEQLGTPNPPAIRFTRGTSFGASRFTHLLRPVRLLALLYGSDRCARPPRAFTSRLPTDRSPSPLLGITTTATGLLCWRDLHPLEWQLASLHRTRTCRIPASGSSQERLANGDIAMDDSGPRKRVAREEASELLPWEWCRAGPSLQPFPPGPFSL